MYNSMKEFLPDWLAALRSGNYKQGKELLRNKNDAFCCLGVAADLLTKQGQAQWLVYDHGHRVVYSKEPEVYSSGFLMLSSAPPWLRGWLAVEAERGAQGVNVQREAILVRWNDNGDTFSEIADRIEQWEAE